MRKRRLGNLALCALFATVFLAFHFSFDRSIGAAQAGAPANFEIDKTSIGGAVVNADSQKPEAGVWVIAQTKELPDPFRKIVVTDDQGRFVVPDLPDASYEVWVRGYGLADSTPIKGSRGDRLTVSVHNAKDPQQAARIYPATSWSSMIEPPAKESLPDGFTSRAEWIALWREGCGQCHQLGMVATRRYTEPSDFDSIFPRNSQMNDYADRLGRGLLEKTLANWSTRIKAGEVPPAPSRPTGLERNVVVSEWDWGDADSFIHDVTSTDKRNPTLYSNGKVYGADGEGARLWILDPVKNTVLSYKTQGRTEPNGWTASPHSPMMDDRGRVWMTTQIRPQGKGDLPKWSRDVISADPNSPAAVDLAYKLLLASRNMKQLEYFDTESDKFVAIDTAYSTHHLQFDREDRLWTNDPYPGSMGALGEIDTKRLDPNNPEGTEKAAQTTYIRVDLATGKRASSRGYAVAVDPVDGTIWQSDPEPQGPENKLYMFDPKTKTYKDYPLPEPGRIPHGIDFSTDGQVWFSAGSGHLGRFNPQTGKFSYWRLPGPNFKDTGDDTGSAEYPYFLWVDQFDTFGLGKNTVFVTGTISDSVDVFDPRTETFSIIRIPYPMPFYSRGLDGRIDDPKAGWKGRGLWSDYSGIKTKWTETRTGYVVHIQIRPDPLAN